MIGLGFIRASLINPIAV